MPMISVSKAAKLFNVSRPTLQKALKDGTITGQKIEAGGSSSWEIDTAELARIYSLRNPDHANIGNTDTPERQRLFMADEGAFSGDNMALRAELDSLREKLAEAERRAAAGDARAEERERLVELYKDQLDRAQEREAALIRRLPAPEDANPTPKPPAGFFARIFGR